MLPAPAPASVTATPPEPHLWLSRYGSDLFRFARRRVATVAAAEELVQETIVSALGTLASFRQESSERTWLFVIMRRRLVDYYRQQARSPLVPLPGAAGNGTYFETGVRTHWRQGEEPREWAAADAQLEQRELVQQLLRCQDQLPTQHQAVFSLRFVEEVSGEEICQQLAITPANYWVILHRAKLQLRKCLEKHWFSGS
ncbi:RNA polymerase, sigma-24 subunit, ECF subfamily [Hymenobacter roseosalivarius DSM 11622]|uniref:RNA polymerase sigma factor n=1 Tax=Hymenobacter roseosalivarius DSM 11622 TaxID=645990 RepID=A0A1W1UJZ6_9BACT|nr:sigma-70 family RNA polymerase sigma factor [Hymenobacter roseosalivarius]SMB81121.1 RNA polymerase, sigma-24 subunit, ECF subfamily [Hymenobacter roseosalivarius DSM 11622]